VIAGEQKWEVEVHGGLSIDRDASGGTISLPATSATVQGFLSLSTFLFGTGASAFNQIRSASPITPLDSALSGPAITRAPSPVGGARLFRGITPRFGVEFSGDFVMGQRKFRDSTLTALEASRASFVQALGATLPSATVNATKAVVDKQDASRLLATGAVVINLKTSGKTIPYIVGGGGIMFNNGGFPSAVLTGTYQVGSPSTLYGTDAVALEYTEDDHSVVYLGGIGLKQQVSQHFGLRVDGRVHLYQSSVINLVDVTPSQQMATSGPPTPIINFGALQFSSLGPLNGVQYAGAQAFATSGLQAQISITVGLFYRF
jgi:hypothetical protein